jgi:hypothetical protein
LLKNIVLIRNAMQQLVVILVQRTITLVCGILSQRENNTHPKSSDDYRSLEKKYIISYSVHSVYTNTLRFYVITHRSAAASGPYREHRKQKT